MNFSIEHPESFLLLIPLVLAAAFTIIRYKEIKVTLSEKKAIKKNTPSYFRMVRCFKFRTLFRFLSGLSFTAALAGISWGTDAVPVQKNDRAVSFVFDISYSMNAKDAPGGVSRLEAAASYAEELLERIFPAKVSVVIAKGEGALSVPLTEDYNSVRSMIECLSPELMTAKGTSIGKGIECAITSFPEQASEASFIWVFTDCEETDGELQTALEKSSRYGIPVAIIGFGSERESEILAGDKKTKIKTALRSDAVEKIMEVIKKKNSLSRIHSLVPSVTYIDASEMGSAIGLLKMLRAGGTQTIVSHEIQAVQRYRLFILLTMAFFLASIFFGELDITGGKRKLMSQITTTAFIVTMLSSCTPAFRDGTKIVNGKIEWNRGNYQQAVANYLDAADCSGRRGDDSIKNYSILGLGTTYLMQGESDAAMERYAQIFDNSPNQIKFSILYNCGIISHRNGDYEGAAEFFKKALTIDNTNVDAKINLELSLKEESAHAKQMQQELTPVSESSSDQILESELFSIIREEEQKQWKNRKSDSEPSPDDY